VKDELIRYLTEEILTLDEGETISADDELLMSGKVDSINVMRLVAFVEYTFGVEVPAEDVTLETFQSVTAIAAYVCQKRSSDR
jgi:acyl carrier protein